jgi:hypothetical protein
MHFNYLLYGTECNSTQLMLFLAHTTRVNMALEQRGELKMPVCIWGFHGIGKTQIVESFARQQQMKFCYVAPAQFEEMGDLTGLPELVRNADGTSVTRLAPPEWVPKEKGPGILLLDDINRADDRILRGLMQLLQRYELVSWRLPEGWQIILTANPDGGDYSVTPMDQAILTRMLHITLKFDVRSWAIWAEENGIDPRGISFVLNYPEIVAGNRTTPRTLVQFFQQIAMLSDLKANLNLVKMLGDACLDEATVTSFISFINTHLDDIIPPEVILNSTHFETEVAPRIDKFANARLKRVDILNIVSTRLVNYIIVNNIEPNQLQAENFMKFLKMEVIPKDLCLLIIQELMRAKSKMQDVILEDSELAVLLLSIK